MLETAGDTAEQEVAEEGVAVRGHGDEVIVLGGDLVEDLRVWFAAADQEVSLDPLGL